jgi:hypothetical protein
MESSPPSLRLDSLELAREQLRIPKQTDEVLMLYLGTAAQAISAIPCRDAFLGRRYVANH